MKAFFKDLGIQVGAVVVVAIGLVSALLAAGKFMPPPFF